MPLCQQHIFRNFLFFIWDLTKRDSDVTACLPVTGEGKYRIWHIAMQAQRILKLFLKVYMNVDTQEV
jgi:hypothetical protein